jgi:O-antigen ligase
MKAITPSRGPVREGVLPHVFAALFGAFLGLSLLKFGNPPTMEKWTTAPKDIYEFLFNSTWPISWAYVLLGLVAGAGVLWSFRKPKCPAWLPGLLLLWYGWQCLAALNSIDSALSASTIQHFTACLVCFGLGLLCLGGIKDPSAFWIGLICGFALVLFAGFEQHFGGLQETRRYFMLYMYHDARELLPGYLAKITSNRIFATLFYPNALAGALLLYLPPSLAVIVKTERLTVSARAFVGTVWTLASLACLFWSGSKGGWLLMLLLGLLAMARLSIALRIKMTVIVMVLVLGLAAFFVRNAGYFGKGATSVSARFDYWRAAIQTTRDHPIFGTGPGTFFIPYSKIKKSESEPARLTHNDYLEQASDSGIPGFLAYTAFIVVALVVTYPPKAGGWVRYAIWLGVLGFCLQGLMEFNLYLPNLAWLAFALMGFLLSEAPFSLRLKPTLPEDSALSSLA